MTLPVLPLRDMPDRHQGLTRALTVVSATSLWFKAKELPQVERVADR